MPANSKKLMYKEGVLRFNLKLPGVELNIRTPYLKVDTSCNLRKKSLELIGEAMLCYKTQSNLCEVSH